MHLLVGVERVGAAEFGAGVPAEEVVGVARQGRWQGLLMCVFIVFLGGRFAVGVVAAGYIVEVV